jgi:carboxylesterase type B
LYYTTELGKGKVYFYNFVERPFFSQKPDFVRADHGDDAAFEFGLSQFSEALGLKIPAESLEATVRTEEVFMQYLINFAKTSIPSGEGLPEWLELRQDGSFMEISSDPRLKQHYEPQQMDLWIKTLPRLQEQARDEL